MHSDTRPGIVWFYAGACLASLTFAAGCENSVREDRTIQFSPNGKTVAFQHGDDGVYVSSSGKLVKVFQPDADTLATSTPLWSPDGKKIIFATAKPAERSSAGAKQPRSGWDDNPMGRIFSKVPVHYTCWLRDMTEQRPDVQPLRLFEADCNHVGYVAASLALRWDSEGKQIFFLDRSAEGQHRVLAFDVEKKTKRPAFPRSADEIVFDYNKTNHTLVCAVQNSSGKEWRTTLWIGRPGQNDWWSLPETSSRGNQSWRSIEQMRRSLPVWTRDGKKFAYRVQTSADPREYEIRSGILRTREIKTLHKRRDPIRDLHWSPDGKRLGFVAGVSQLQLHFVTGDGSLSILKIPNSVRRFVGWNFDGQQLAYTIMLADPPKTHGPQNWALLMARDPWARDAVLVAPGNGATSGRIVFSNMRVTFPRWSPTEDKLSFWGTFTPSHRYLGNAVRSGGLRPGDPALELDVRTGAVQWLAVNAFEKTQVGHYYLLKRDYAEAARWYEAAATAKAGIPKPGNDRGSRTAANAVFRFHSLKKLGRDADAADQVSVFRKSTVLLPRSGLRSDEQDQTRIPSELTTALARSFLAVEVFLSLNAEHDAVEFLQTELRAADSDSKRLATAIALAQCQLLNGRDQEYLDCVTDTVLPLFVKLWKPEYDSGRRQSFDSPWSELLIAITATLVPLWEPEFRSRIAEKTIRHALSEWLPQRDRTKSSVAHLLIDRLLHSAYLRLGENEKAGNVARRIKLTEGVENSTSMAGIPTNAKQLRALSTSFLVMRQIQDHARAIVR